MSNNGNDTKSVKMTITVAKKTAVLLNDLSEQKGLSKSAVVSLAVHDYWDALEGSAKREEEMAEK